MSKEAMGMSFSMALDNFEKGVKIARRSWKRKKWLVLVETPDDRSEMTQRHLCVVHPESDAHPMSRAPWLPSQDDMFARDWEFAQDLPGV